MVSRLKALLVAAIISLWPPAALAQFNSGSDGSDGGFAPPAFVETVVDLSQAVPGAWSANNSANAGRGVYDAANWAVVFKYTTITIPTNATIRFINHPSNAPVVWLASGDVSIAAGATIIVSGENESSPGVTYARPGPGGFHGGAKIGPGSRSYSAGLGPGAGQYQSGGSFATTGVEEPGGRRIFNTYGNSRILPLIGGSGGGGSANASSSNGGGGAGGGAIAIASSGNITLNGAIQANGGNGKGRGDSPQPGSGGGSGGAIRLVANTITGSAAGLLALPGGTNNSSPQIGRPGGNGRISVEANSISLTGGSNPAYVAGAANEPVFRSDVPTLRATTIDANAFAADPGGGLDTPDAVISNTNAVTLNIQATSIPVGTLVQVHVIPERGDAFNVNSGPLVGTFASSATTARLTLPRGRVEIQLKANY